MKAAVVIGIAIASFGLLFGASQEGTPLGALWNIPAFFMVVIGTLGVCFAASGLEGMKMIPTLYKKAIVGERTDLRVQVETIISYAERARREGLLALEQELEQVEDDFTRKGLQLVVDGTDPELVREILELEADAMAARHKAGQEVFKTAAGFAPTMGIIGTVMGLVAVLQKLDQPELLGPAISAAFMATLYGVGTANVIFLPVQYRLKALSETEQEMRALTVEGILAVQAGDNPRVVGEKLMTFVAPAARVAPDEPGKPDLRAVADPPAAEAA